MPLPAEHLKSIVDHDGAVILDIDHDAMLTLNPIGGYVWEKLQQGRLIEEIVRELATETGTDPTTVDRDVRAFVDDLKSRHLFAA
jgi:hypothetical protein